MAGIPSILPMSQFFMRLPGLDLAQLLFNKISSANVAIGYRELQNVYNFKFTEIQHVDRIRLKNGWNFIQSILVGVGVAIQ